MVSFSAFAEENRLESLLSYEIMDTEAEGAFDDLVHIAALTCGVSSARVTFIDAQRQFVKASVGLDASREAPLSSGFCPYTVLQQGLLVIPDTRIDSRYAGNSVVVEDPFIRFYAGVPIRSPENHLLGTMSVLDREPHEFPDASGNALQKLARQLEQLLALRRLLAEQVRSDKKREVMERDHAQAIRERKALQRLAERRAAELEAVIEDMPAGVYIGGEEGISLCNRLGLDMLGFSSLEEMRDNIAHLAARLETRFVDTGRRVQPDEDIFVRAFRYGERITREVELHHLQTGRKVVIESAVAPIYDREGEEKQIVAAVAVNVDITAQKATLEEVRQNTEYLRLALDAGKLGSYVLDVASGKMQCSKQCKANFGISSDSVFNFDDLIACIYEEDRPHMQKAVDTALRERIDYSIEYRIRVPQGNTRWIAARGRAVYNSNGEPIQMIGVTQDVTADRVAQQAVEKSDTRYRRLLATTHEGVLSLSPDDHILYANQQMAVMVGYDSAEDLIGKNAYEILLFPEDRIQGEERRRRRQEGMENQFEVRLRRRDNTVCWVIASVNVERGEKGEYLGTFSLFTDITARREAEAALQASASQQRRFVREMLASVTEGKLCLAEAGEDLPEPLAFSSEPIDLTPTSLRQLRKAVEAVSTEMGLPQDRVQDLLTAVGEAGMNAVKYGGGGIGRIYTDPLKKVVQVWIEDQGQGIPEKDLHRATLEKGWSGSDSLGHGFFLILRSVDRTFLLTGPQGTTLVLEQESQAPQPAWMRSFDE